MKILLEMVCRNSNAELGRSDGLDQDSVQQQATVKPTS